MRRTFILVVLFAFCGTEEALADDNKTKNVCVTLSIPDDEMSLLRGISKRLSQFLDTNLEKGHQSLNKVLNSFSAIRSLPVKVDLNDPLESFLLQHQIATHMEISKTLQEIKTFLQLGPKEEKNVIPYEKSSPLQLSENKSSYRPTDFTLRPSDCSELLVAGHTDSSIYDIYPFSCKCSEPVQVLCDMETDGGGWTIFLFRNNVSKPINFIQNWENYSKGFGSPKQQEYWLGNKHLHSLTFNRNYVLRLEAKNGFGREIWGEWDQFSVDDEENKYMISVSKYNGKSTSVDLFSYFNAMVFSTFDNDNDKNPENCAEKYKGGWWYNNCYNHINPTGVQGIQDNSGIRLNPWSIHDKTVRFASWIQLKIRPPVCRTHISTATLNTHNCV